MGCRVNAPWTLLGLSRRASFEALLDRGAYVYSEVMPFVVIARFRAREGSEGELRAVLEGLVEPTRAEAGCLHYELVQSQKDPREFTFFEKWASEEALAAHTQTPHVQRARQERVPFLDGPTDVTRWDLVL